MEFLDGFDSDLTFEQRQHLTLTLWDTDQVLAVIEDPGTGESVALVRRPQPPRVRCDRVGFRGRCGGFYGRDMLQIFVRDAQDGNEDYPDWQGIMEQLLAGDEGVELGIVPKPRKPAKRKQKLDMSAAATRKRVGAVRFGR